MRDLEIRGAGNILGKAQHGHMVAIGYEMYISMLEKAVSKLQNNKEESVEENISLKEVKIDLPVSAFISDKYIPDLVQKITMYHKISEIKDEKDSLNVIEELLDRYGDMPKEVENLIKIVEIRNICRKLNITKVMKKDSYLVLSNNSSNQELKYFINTKDIWLFTQFNLKELEKLTNI